MPAFAFQKAPLKVPPSISRFWPGDVAGVRRAQERAGRAELVRIAEALGRDAGHAVGARLLRSLLLLLLGGLAQRAAQAVGIEGAGQDDC